MASGSRQLTDEPGVRRHGLRPDEAAHSGNALPMSDVARRVRALSTDRWGPSRAVEMVGRAQNYLHLLAKVTKVAGFSEPVLITGESGVGKELLAQAIYLLGQPAGRPFVSVNCPQFQEDNLTVSELFGHVRGSFTGAVADRHGAFDEADGGVIFLDEIADLNPGTQAMLLRTLSTGELKPLGAAQSHSVNVRVVAATNEPINHLVMSKRFRYDLFFRLRYFHLDVPPLRERGDDWALILEYFLRRLCERHGVRKSFAPTAMKRLETYHWPGNVRQLGTLVTTGYAMADGDTIDLDDIESLIDDEMLPESDPEDLWRSVVDGQRGFWEAVHDPYMNRDLNRSQLNRFIRKGLAVSENRYSRLLELLRLPASDYQRFMDFLRHHHLKP